LWDRLKKAGRLHEDSQRESNVAFLRPYDEVVATWRRALAHANEPERLFERFRYQIDATYANRIKPPARGQLTWPNLRRGLVLLYNVLVKVGLKSDYRRAFWQAARYALRRGRIDAMLSMGFMAYHMIHFTREALRGDQNASFYSTKEHKRRPEPVGEAVPLLRKSA
jgi:hopanoid C-2 methylase